MAKFHEVTPFGSKDPSSNTLHFRAIFDSHLKKVVRGPPSPVKSALVRLGDSLARVQKFGSAAPPRGRNMVFRKMRFRGVRFHIEISKVTGPNFTGLVSPNAGGIAIDEMTIRFSISLSVSEIFDADLRSRPKSGQILHVFGP